MSLQQPDLDLASVVHVTTRHPKWIPLDCDEPLALLYSKFLGKSVTCEEPSRGPPHLGDQRMDLDDRNDDDIIKGPYILNIEMTVFPSGIHEYQRSAR